MEVEESLGQITAAIGRVCLRFKNAPEAPPPKGQIFAKCTFLGRGSSFFVPAPPAADGEALAAPVDNVTGSELMPPPIVQSEPVDMTKAAITSSQAEERSAAGVVVISDHGDDLNTSAAADVEADVDAGVVLVDVGFSLDTAKFGLDEPTLSMLDTTDIKIDLCLCDDTETKIGTASIRVSSILSGKNEYTHELALGKYVAEEAGAARGVDKPDGALAAEAADGGDEGAATDAAVVVQDVSPGPLEFGGSTSTMRVTLLTNDDTADYTLGAGSLWTDGAEITGVPEGWKVVPPPETERSAWNDAIAQTLAGENKRTAVSARRQCNSALVGWHAIEHVPRVLCLAGNTACKVKFYQQVTSRHPPCCCKVCTCSDRLLPSGACVLQRQTSVEKLLHGSTLEICVLYSLCNL